MNSGQLRPRPRQGRAADGPGRFDDHPSRTAGAWLGAQPSNRQRRLLLHEYTAADALPLMGVANFDDFNGRMVLGEPTIEPRIVPAPVRMPLPPPTIRARSTRTSAPRVGASSRLSRRLPMSARRRPSTSSPRAAVRRRLGLPPAVVGGWRGRQAQYRRRARHHRLRDRRFTPLPHHRLVQGMAGHLQVDDQDVPQAALSR